MAAMSSGLFRPSAAPVSTLGNQFSGDEFLRMRSGQLHRGRPLNVKEEAREPDPLPEPTGEDKMELSDVPVARHDHDPSSTSAKQESPAPIESRAPNSELSPAMIDPALSGVAASSAGELDERDVKADENWVMMARTIESLRSWIQRRVENGEFEPEDEQHKEARETTEERTEPTPSLYPVLGELKTAA
jgi:hypothetical protein